MPNKNDSAAWGEGNLSSPQSSEARCAGGTGELFAESPAPVVDVVASWDPYQVWLTRVKEPREQSARKRSRPVAVESAEKAGRSEDPSPRTLFHALHR